MFDINWRGLLLPLAYLVVLVGTFMTFSRVYRKRKAGTCAACTPSLRATRSARSDWQSD
jgi:translocation protein SEC66